MAIGIVLMALMKDHRIQRFANIESSDPSELVEVTMFFLYTHAIWNLIEIWVMLISLFLADVRSALIAADI